MTPEERRLFDSTVHGLRSRGWSRIEAEGEALARIDRARRTTPLDLGGCVIGLEEQPDGSIRIVP